MNQNSHAATVKSFYSQGSKQCLIKISCYLISWNVLAKMWSASRQGNTSLKSACWTNFFIFTRGSCTCYARKAQDGNFLEDLFAVGPETWVALDTAYVS